MTLTEKTIIGMLQENTGRHFLDSGGAYGRAWERNQALPPAAWLNRPETSATFGARDGELEIEITHEVLPFVRDAVDYSPAWQARLTRYAKKHPDDHYLALMEGFAGQYGSHLFTQNTYNGTDLLRQTLQYVQFQTDDEIVILLQIHGGCDVRGGYTAPKAFTARDEYPLCRNADATIWCSAPLNDHPVLLEGAERYPHVWTTDDGYHYYDSGACGAGAGLQLERYPAVESDDPIEPGAVRVDSDKHAYCPKCGGLLQGGR